MTWLLEGRSRVQVHMLANPATSHVENQRAGPASGPVMVDPLKGSISCPIELWLVKKSWRSSGLGSSLGNRMWELLCLVMYLCWIAFLLYLIGPGPPGQQGVLWRLKPAPSPVGCQVSGWAAELLHSQPPEVPAHSGNCVITNWQLVGTHCMWMNHPGKFFGSTDGIVILKFRRWC